MLVETLERYNKGHNSAAISVSFKESAGRAVALAALSGCVLMSLFTAGGIACRG